ncbi:MAG TPA: hypothetical protein VGA20_11010 [Gemmatimonadales bacterium]
MSHPAPDVLVPYALGAGDGTTARHVDACATCQTEIERLQEAAGLLRGSASFERWIETPDCLDELVIADFVEGRLTSEARAPVVTHLLSCARCRAVVKATSYLVADNALAARAPARGWRRWSLPLGVAAAAALLLMLVPQRSDDGLREPPLTRTVAPVPITPQASVTRVDQLVWSSVPHAERYRLRLYDAEGSVVWRLETTDTVGLLPDSVVLAPGVSYFWRVEAQTEWQRWATSDLIEFRLGGRAPR